MRLEPHPSLGWAAACVAEWRQRMRGGPAAGVLLVSTARRIGGRVEPYDATLAIRPCRQRPMRGRLTIATLTSRKLIGVSMTIGQEVSPFHLLRPGSHDDTVCGAVRDEEVNCGRIPGCGDGSGVAYGIDRQQAEITPEEVLGGLYGGWACCQASQTGAAPNRNVPRERRRERR